MKIKIQKTQQRVRDFQAGDHSGKASEDVMAFHREVEGQIHLASTATLEANSDSNPVTAIIHQALTKELREHSTQLSGIAEELRAAEAARTPPTKLCPQCNVYVPVQKFCGECATPLGSV